jgi:hypothetical protein
MLRRFVTCGYLIALHEAVVKLLLSPNASTVHKFKKSAKKPQPMGTAERLVYFLNHTGRQHGPTLWREIVVRYDKQPFMSSLSVFLNYYSIHFYPCEAKIP